MITVHIPTPLRRFTGERSQVDVSGETVGQVLRALVEEHPGLKKNLFSDQGILRSYINVYVNDEDIRFQQKDATPLRAGDKLSIVPSIAGGIS